MKNENIRRAFLAALPRTLPVFAGYCFLGMTYGISMLDKFRGTGAKKFYLIYGMVDESFSINFQSVLAPSFSPDPVPSSA